MSTQQYRDLVPGDRMLVGDEIEISIGEWVPIHKARIGKLKKNDENRIRRPIPEPATPQPVTAASVLQHAAELLVERGQQHDKPEGERSMAATVQVFNTITGRDLTEAEGWLLMVALKLVRANQRPGYACDSYHDAAAYVGLMAEAKAKTI